MFENSDELFDFLDDERGKTLVEMNLEFEKAKELYIQNTLANIDSFIVDNKIVTSYTVNKEINDNLFDSLNVLMDESVDVAIEHYYKETVDYIVETIEKEENVTSKYNINEELKAKILEAAKKKKELTKKEKENIKNGFIAGFGLNYEYNQKLEEYKIYFNERLSNTIRLMMEKKVKDLVSKNYEKDVQEHKDIKKDAESRINNTDKDYQNEIAIEKKMIANLYSTAMIYTANKTMLTAMELLGLSYVVRRGVKDKSTCKYCLSIMDNEYLIDEIPSVPSHPSCRCYYEPILDKYKKK